MSPRSHLARPVFTPVFSGAAAFTVFYADVLAARRVPVLRIGLSRVLCYADRDRARWLMFTTLANGAAEEVVVCGAVYAAVDGRHPVAVYSLAIP